MKSESHSARDPVFGSVIQKGICLLILSSFAVIVPDHGQGVIPCLENAGINFDVRHLVVSYDPLGRKGGIHITLAFMMAARIHAHRKHKGFKAKLLDDGI